MLWDYFKDHTRRLRKPEIKRGLSVSMNNIDVKH